MIGALLLLVGAGMLWSACGKLLHPASIPSVHITALWVALAALTAKEMLFRYMLRAAKQIQSSMLIANARHARSDAASSVVVAVGIIGNLAGFAWLDPVAALAVGALVTRMGYTFSYDALHDLMDRSVDSDSEQQIITTILATPGVVALHDLKPDAPAMGSGRCTYRGAGRFIGGGRARYCAVGPRAGAKQPKRAAYDDSY